MPAYQDYEYEYDGRTYAVGDTCEYKGNFYLCITAHSGGTKHPDDATYGDSYWRLIASKTGPLLGIDNFGHRLSLVEGDSAPADASGNVVYLTTHTTPWLVLSDPGWATDGAYKTIPVEGLSLDMSNATNYPANTNYDIFVYVPTVANEVQSLRMKRDHWYLGSNPPLLEAVAWTNSTTRATDVVRVSTTWGCILCKNGEYHKRYVGTVRKGPSVILDTKQFRFVYNFHNKLPRELSVTPSSGWNYASTTWRQSNGSSNNYVGVVAGREDITVDLTHLANLDTPTVGGQIGIGVGVTTAPTGQVSRVGAGADGGNAVARICHRSALGHKNYFMLEKCESNATVLTNAPYTGFNGVVHI